MSVLRIRSDDTLGWQLLTIGVEGSHSGKMPSKQLYRSVLQ